MCLYDKVTYNENHVPNLQETLTPLKDVSNATGIDYDLIIKYHHGIPDDQAMCHNPENGDHMIYLKRNGIDAAIEEYWLREGQKELNERIYDKTKWVVPVFALIATIGSLLYTVSTVKDTSQKVVKLESDLKEARGQINSLIDMSNKFLQNDNSVRNVEQFRYLDSLIHSKSKK